MGSVAVVAPPVEHIGAGERVAGVEAFGRIEDIVAPPTRRPVEASTGSPPAEVAQAIEEIHNGTLTDEQRVRRAIGHGAQFDIHVCVGEHAVRLVSVVDGGLPALSAGDSEIIGVGAVAPELTLAVWVTDATRLRIFRAA